MTMVIIIYYTARCYRTTKLVIIRTYNKYTLILYTVSYIVICCVLWRPNLYVYCISIMVYIICYKSSPYNKKYYYYYDT